SMSSMKSGVHRASELIDKKVQNDQGEDLGKVKDVVLMGDRIRYVVLSRDGVLGMGGDMIPIPFTMISSANMSEDSIIVSNLDKDKLDKAPTVSEQDWENQLQNPSFESKVFGYYGEQQPSSSQMEQPSSSQMEQPSMPSEGSESGMESSESESGFGSSPSPGSGSSSGTETGGSSGSGY
ncbi:MAG TPA: PRC-barrel domain-containing protein, partial [Thermodesulfobacteriota bacterium]|nr:PRC-barrel domain-containing protein [Thermodesulfobacteriota bacterium]